jgi:hypothetical protein
VPGFFGRVWARVEPFLEGLLADTLISASLYLALYFFSLLAKYLPIPGWAGTFVENLHAVGIVLAVACFVVLFIVDIMRIQKEQRR